MEFSKIGLTPQIFGIIGVLFTLSYIKGMEEISKGCKLMFWGFVSLLLAKIFIITGYKSVGFGNFAFLSALLSSGFLLILASLALRNIPIATSVVISSLALLIAWSYYIGITTNDASLAKWSILGSGLGYVFLCSAFWHRKNAENSLGYILAGWVNVILILLKIANARTWGADTMSTIASTEAVSYLFLMFALLMISNNMMADQFDSLVKAKEDTQNRLKEMVKMSPFPIIISKHPSAEVMLMNDSAKKLFGLRRDGNVPSNFRINNYFADPGRQEELLAQIGKERVVDDFEFQLKSKNSEGLPVWLLVCARIFDYDKKIALYMAFQDISDRKNKELQLFDQATRDPMTKCYNRRQFNELAKNEVQRSRRYGHPFCLFMIDADHFKSVNDTHGHATGDKVLMSLADCCRRTLRESDIISRFGGEEFVIVLPEASLEDGHKVAERLRIRISKIRVKNEQNEDVQFTVSIGLVPSTVTDNIEDMLKMSDEALYEAKEHGRNQVVIYGENGPDRSIPVPNDAAIEKVKGEDNYYFTPEKMVMPSNTPRPVQTFENSAEKKKTQNLDTAIAGVKASANQYIDDGLDEDLDDGIPLGKDSGRAMGVSLDEIYDADEDDDPAFKSNIANRVAPPTAMPSFYSQEEIEQNNAQELSSNNEQPLEQEESIPVPTQEEMVEEELPIEQEAEIPPQEQVQYEEQEIVEEEVIETPMEQQEYSETEFVETPIEDNSQELVEEQPNYETQNDYSAPIEEENVEVPSNEAVQEDYASEELIQENVLQEDVPQMEVPSVPEEEQFVEDTEIPQETDFSLPPVEENISEIPEMEAPKPEFEIPVPVDMDGEEETANKFAAMPVPPPVSVPAGITTPPRVLKKIVLKKMPIKAPFSTPGQMPGIVKLKIPKTLNPSSTTEE
ncbi:MAG: diguanylate cyclase [Alphaproteobacteria bacterium]|nr:diguanylate cyclase [Alphaproteobacteria bacterium]